MDAMDIFLKMYDGVSNTKDDWFIFSPEFDGNLPIKEFTKLVTLIDGKLIRDGAIPESIRVCYDNDGNRDGNTGFYLYGRIK